jgi:KDO2-lipid IV(A) lauroyltransferase
MPPLRKRIKRYLRYLLIRSTLFWLSLWPLSWASRLGRAFGSLGYLVAGGERRKALESLQVAFAQLSEQQRNDIARRCFQHLGQAAFELACIRQIDRRMAAFVEWPAESRAVLDEALAEKRGVVFITGHVGNWELLARRVALAGYPAQSIAKETSDPRMTALVERFRAAGKVGSIWRGQGGAAKHMLRALKAGEILGLLIDQDTNVQNVFVPFFGELAATPRAAADLALRTNAAVVVGFCKRLGTDARYRLTMKRVTPGASTGDKDQDAVALTTLMSNEIEAAIKSTPEQWVWMHKRWKTRP